MRKTGSLGQVKVLAICQRWGVSDDTRTLYLTRIPLPASYPLLTRRRHWISEGQIVRAINCMTSDMSARPLY